MKVSRWVHPAGPSARRGTSRCSGDRSVPRRANQLRQSPDSHCILTAVPWTKPPPYCRPKGVSSTLPSVLAASAAHTARRKNGQLPARRSTSPPPVHHWTLAFPRLEAVHGVDSHPEQHRQLVALLGARGSDEVDIQAVLVESVDLAEAGVVGRRDSEAGADVAPSVSATRGGGVARVEGERVGQALRVMARVW